MINTVKISGDGFVVNGNLSVPTDPANRDFQAVQRWLEGKTDEWLALEEAQKQAQASHDAWAAIQSYEADLAAYEAAQAQYEVDIAAFNEAFESFVPGSFDENGVEIEAPSLEDAPVAPTSVEKPEGYFTQEEVDASVAAHAAWAALSEEEKAMAAEPVVLKRPADLVEPVIPELPAPVPNEAEPEFTAEELAAQALAQAKIDRDVAVAEIDVTTTSGKTFDGDEKSQERMARAITVSEATGVTSTQWKMADNTFAEVTVDELKEALVLAGQAQMALWVQAG